MIFVDLETRSAVPISQGGRAYARCPRLALLVGAAVDLDAARGWVWSPWPGPTNGAGWEAPVVPGVEVEWSLHWECAAPPFCADVLVAHNAWGFDRPVWRALGYPEARWLDSLPRARRAALPGRLDELAKLAFDAGKDPKGEHLIRKFCVPNKKGEIPDPPPPALTGLARYCARDVALLAGIWQYYHLGDPHVDDPMLELDDKINDYGWGIDRDYVQRVAAAEARIVKALVDECGVPREVLSSDQQFRSWLKSQGVDAADVQAVTLEGLL